MSQLSIFDLPPQQARPKPQPKPQLKPQATAPVPPARCAQFLYRSAGEPPVKAPRLLGPGCCCLCGGHWPQRVDARDAFGSGFADYDQLIMPAEAHICVPCKWVMSGKPPDTLRMWSGVVVASGELPESHGRKMRVRKGLATKRALAPIGNWTGDDVFAYAYARSLPVHESYAMTFGGRLDRTRVRVSAVGGPRGDGMGRHEWEMTYYGDVIRRANMGEQQ